MLTRCYKAELAKLLRGKGIYIALAIMVAMILLLIAMSNMLDGVVSMPGAEGGTNLADLLKRVPREQYGDVIATLESQLKLLETESNTIWSRFVDTKGRYEAYINVFKYLEVHEEIDAKELTMPDAMMLDLSKNATSFMLTVISIAFQIAVFYGVIVMSSLVAGEAKDGTLRMQLLRPNSRSKILSSKWLASFTISVGIFLVGVMLGAIYAGAHFNFGSKNIICMIANKHAFLMNENVFLLLDVLTTIFAIFALIQFSNFMCAIASYNRAASMAVPIIVLLFGNTSAYLLQVMYLGVLDFANNLNLMQFLLPTSQLMTYTSLYSAIPVLLVYVTTFTAVSYIRFNKTEL